MRVIQSTEAIVILHIVVMNCVQIPWLLEAICKG